MLRLKTEQCFAWWGEEARWFLKVLQPDVHRVKVPIPMPNHKHRALIFAQNLYSLITCTKLFSFVFAKQVGHSDGLLKLFRGPCSAQRLSVWLQDTSVTYRPRRDSAGGAAVLLLKRLFCCSPAAPTTPLLPRPVVVFCLWLCESNSFKQNFICGSLC